MNDDPLALMRFAVMGCRFAAYDLDEFRGYVGLKYYVKYAAEVRNALPKHLRAEADQMLAPYRTKR